MLRFDFNRFIHVSTAKSSAILLVSWGVTGCTHSPDKDAAVNTEQARSTIQNPVTESKSTTDTETTLPKISDEAFLEAALGGDESVVKRGVRQGIRVDFIAEDKRTALMLAAFNGHKSIVKYLLEHDATVDARDAIQRTALMYAATTPNVETVQLLIDAGANVNAADAEESWTPLMMAAAEGHVEVVALLLMHGANASSKDVDGETALQFAASKGHQSVVELLSK